jgi:predicted dehydrogenase
MLCAIGGNTAIFPDFRDGLKVCRVLDAVERSAETREWVAV